jgi:MFS transporter, NNP family, nitrate/nitrite transporter
MPAFYDILMSRYGLSSHWAWRDSFFLPFGLIVSVAVLMLLLCPDTPTGKWSERKSAVMSSLVAQHAAGHPVAHNGAGEARHAGHHVHEPAMSDAEKGEKGSDEGIDVAQREVLEVDEEYTCEIIQDPTPKEMAKVVMSPQTLVLMAAYFNSFGAELAVNGILGAYYLKNFPYLNQARAARWAAIFGTQNFIGRPLGGIISDLIYKYTGGSLWAKKIWIHVCGLLMGMFLIIIGALDTHDRPLMIGLVFCLGVSLFSTLSCSSNSYSFSWTPEMVPTFHLCRTFILLPMA